MMKHSHSDANRSILLNALQLVGFLYGQKQEYITPLHNQLYKLGISVRNIKNQKSSYI